jgi:dipeptidyl aminopeptidase/acylaminoacyl peptidase
MLLAGSSRSDRTRAGSGVESVQTSADDPKGLFVGASIHNVFVLLHPKWPDKASNYLTGKLNGGQMMRRLKRLRRIGVAIVFAFGVIVVAAILYLRFPWITTETVQFQNGDVTLVGTLALPRWLDGPYPAVVIVHGSGSLPRWTLWPYAKHLVPPRHSGPDVRQTRGR